METITKGKQIEAVSGWWNSDQIVKWDKQYDEWDSQTVRSLNRRLEKLLGFVDTLKLPKGAKVLELGYGAGQTALKIGQRGYEVHGVDISEKLCEIANQRCARECPGGKFYFKTGNIESRLEHEDDTFDLVVASGVLHYLYDDDACLKEAYRVLKPGGYLIIAQRTAYALNHFLSMRMFLCSCLYFILREKYELFPSYRAILCDSKLRAIFGKFENSRFFNSKFMLKGHDFWKYKLKKKLYSNHRLKSLCKRSGFRPLKLAGAYYCVSDERKYFNFNLKVDDFFESLAAKKFFHFVNRLARITVILSQKRQ